MSCSSEVVDVIREYERFSTAAMNAFIGPRTSFYLNNLDRALKENGVDAQIRVMQSNGGVTTLAGAAERPVTILMSGPAGGVIGGQWAGDMSGVRNLIYRGYRRHVGGHQRRAGRRGPHHEPERHAGGWLPDPWPR